MDLEVAQEDQPLPVLLVVEMLVVLVVEDLVEDILVVQELQDKAIMEAVVLVQYRR